MYDQLYPYFDNVFKTAVRFKTQYCFLSMIEKWCKSLDVGGHAGAALTDLSKAFDYINHELLIAKLNACAVDKVSLGISYSSLTK